MSGGCGGERGDTHDRQAPPWTKTTSEEGLGGACAGSGAGA